MPIFPHTYVPSAWPGFREPVAFAFCSDPSAGRLEPGRTLYTFVPKRNGEEGVIAVVDRETREVLFVSPLGEGLEGWLIYACSGKALEWAMANPERRHEVLRVIEDVWYAYDWIRQFPEDKNLLRESLRSQGAMVHVEDIAFWTHHHPEDVDLLRPTSLRSADVCEWVRNVPGDRVWAMDFLQSLEDVRDWVDMFPEDQGPFREWYLTTEYGQSNPLAWLLYFPDDRDFLIPYFKNTWAALWWVNRYPEDRELVRHLITDKKELEAWTPHSATIGHWVNAVFRDLEGSDG